MPRFYVDPPSGDFVVLSGENAQHICRSLRMAPGESLTLCDSHGTDYKGVIRCTDGQTVTVDLLSKEASRTEPSVFVRLYQALPKGDKMEWIIQKAVELGVGEIIPVLSSRCVSRPDEKTMAKKIARWQKIAEEAAKQCGRGRIPTVRPLLPFSLAVQSLAKTELGLFLYEKGGEPFKKVLSVPAKEIGFLVGAEGGFSPEEAQQIQETGPICTVSLGTRILRCETAPLAALAALMYQSDNL